MKKSIAILLFLLCNLELSAISSSLNYRTTSSSPLLFALKDYSKKESGFEVAPLYASMYDTDHTNEALILNQKNTLTFDQLGNGDFNPFWINLISNEQTADYLSQVTFTPEQSQAGMLFHGYIEFPKIYIDLRTALLEMSSKVTIDEQGGGNGAEEHIKNVQQAFTNPSWNYGKIGESHQVVGLDNIQLEIGTTCSTQNSTLALFGLVEAPTGAGSQAEWLFEPKVGTNHWGLGFGTESITHLTHRTNLFFGGNYRYFFPAWEKRSFDLTVNGQWSRYLGLQDTYGLVNGNFIGAAPDVDPLPGINYLTQSAYIEGRNQVNLYLSLETKFKKALFKIGYNYFYSQAETINEISKIVPGFGVYYISDPSGGGGGITTSSTAKINETSTAPDPLPTLSNPLAAPVAITPDMFNKKSGACQEIYSNRLSTSIQGFCGACTYGVGANVDIAMTSSALSTWAIWASVEYTFGKENDHYNDELPIQEIENNSINDIPNTPTPAENEHTNDSVDTYENENENFLHIMNHNNQLDHDEESSQQVSASPTISFIMAATVPFPDNSNNNEELQTTSVDEIPEPIIDLSNNTTPQEEANPSIMNNPKVTTETNILKEDDIDNKEDLSIEIPYKKLPVQPLMPQETIGLAQEAVVNKKDNGLMLPRKQTKSQLLSTQRPDNLVNINTTQSFINDDAQNSAHEQVLHIKHETAHPMTNEDGAISEKCNATKTPTNDCGCKTICLDHHALLNKKHKGLRLQKKNTLVRNEVGSQVTSEEVITFQDYGHIKNLTNDEILQVLHETK